MTEELWSSSMNKVKRSMSLNPRMYLLSHAELFCFSISDISYIGEMFLHAVNTKLNDFFFLYEGASISNGLKH